MAANSRAWLAAAIVLLCIALPELVLRGIVDGKPMGLAVGVVFLAASALCFWQARYEKRQAELRKPDATEEPPEPDQPQ
ncbi:hypothetical protein LWF15_15310 [Kineosporia rhizophila]|uniref:hypothetical protein n=1 Tax=Kineosporia TaxID=49184 RepID=UPI001E3153BD|nr:MULTISPECIES: hypothetical protein [Kineosporia]MCE0536872.1 hypothetical protein [Kineosporia rhizophila]GLY19027.1 hypothetical protein Kisp01_60410 [Kineosporia sp. NBRC 101677]